MKMTLSDTVEVNAPIDAVMKFSTNLSEIASCIPTAQNFKQIDDKNFTVDVTVGVAFIRGIFEIRCTLVEQNLEHIVYNIEGAGIGSTIKIMLSLDPNPKSATSTEVKWTGDSELTGLVTGVSETVLRKVSDDKLKDIIANIKAKLEKDQVK